MWWWWFACAPEGVDRAEPTTEPTTTAPTEPTEPTEPTTTEPTIVPVDCTEACADTSPGAAFARCTACQCKAAMDGWLPSPSELQCSLGAEMVVYEALPDGSLAPVDADVSTCANPSLLYGTCAPGGRLGQMSHGDVMVKWICRQNVYKPDATSGDPSVTYDDVGAILTNTRTGATCFFDDMDGTGLAGDNWPQMDLEAPDADPEAFVQFFYNTLGEGCVGCHDSDPFIYTPQLQSVGWETGAHVRAPMSLVGLDGALQPVDVAWLVSPEVAACTACHRLGSGATCGAWAASSMGVGPGYGTQPEVADAGFDPTDPLWPVAVWMPPDISDPEAFEAGYGLARDTILRCCEQPGVDQPASADGAACVWERL